jgi:hypothetical protein
MRRGMGMGFGGILGTRISPGYPGAANPGDELSILRDQAADLKTELDRIHQRIEALERNKGK